VVTQFSEIELVAILITYVIPILLFSFALKLLLEKIRIFRSSTVNWGIAFVIAFSSLYFIRGIYSIIMAVSIFAICVFKMGGLKGFLIGIVATFLYFIFALPFLLNFLS